MPRSNLGLRIACSILAVISLAAAGLGLASEVFAKVAVIFTTISVATAIFYLTGFSATRALKGVCVAFLVGLYMCNMAESAVALCGVAVEPDDPVVRGLFLQVEHVRPLANCVAAIGLNGCILGIVLARRRFKRAPRIQVGLAPRVLHTQFDSGYRYFIVVAIGLLIVFFVESVRTGMIAAEYGAASGSKLMITTMQLTLSSCVILAAVSNTRNQVLTSLGYSTVALFLNGLLGWRGHTMAFVYASIIVVVRRLRRVKMRYLVSAYVMISVLWTTIEHVRSQPINERNYIREVASSAVSPITYLAPLQILTRQEMSLRYGVRYARDNGLGLGKWYARAAQYIVPNVWREARDSEKDALTSIALTVSSTYIVTYGIGFTPIAEAYVDFGLLGAFTVMFAAGYLLMRGDVATDEAPDEYHLVVNGMTGAGVIWWLRNDSMQLGRFIVWGVLLYLLIRTIIRKPNREFSV